MSIFRIPRMPLQTTESDIKMLFEMVKASSYVNGNSDYKKKANNTVIKFDADNDAINAYAHSTGNQSYGIHIFNGLCNGAIFMAIALAEFKQDNDVERLKDACRWLGNTAINNGGDFTASSISRGINEFNYSPDGIIATEAKSYTAGALISTIAHEQGHICLSHVIREEDSGEVSRNDERQADLFGCSVTATTPFASHIILASLFQEIIFSWMEDEESIATTHPYGRERVYNTLNSHDAVLRDLGITKDNIDEFLR